MQVLKFNQCPLCHQTFSVKVSDSLGMAYGEFEAVEAIHTVVRNGTFARFIPSGMIVISAAARRPALYRSRTLHSRSESMLPSV